MGSKKLKKCHIVYPHQLFEEVFSFPKETHFLLVEDPLFFRDKKYPRDFHKQKLVLHRASMKAFADRLKKQHFKLTYLEYEKYPDPNYVVKFLKKEKFDEIEVFDPTDYVLEKRLEKAFSGPSLDLCIIESPNFLTPLDTIHKFFKGKKKLLMNNFYIFQRKRLEILIDGKGNPTGGRWNFDVENRKRLPKNVKIPSETRFKKSNYVKEAITYVNRHFKKNPGVAEDFNHPITHQEAKKLLSDFLHKRFAEFGPYEDAISKKDSVLFHSMLSAPLNIGLLDPMEIVEEALSMEKKVPIASLEGFIRQVIGWREFMRAVYVLRGSKMRTQNALKHKNKLPASLYDGSTGIEPIDETIKKIESTAYCHHIERLMVLGNFMLLLQIQPDDIYAWFMDMFIDAYDWVMVPNVYAMSQFADGGTITTKPYFSSSNYILKMSDYSKGDWCQVWDGLFYNFLSTHRKLISANPRLRVLIKNLDRLPKEKLREMKSYIKDYI